MTEHYGDQQMIRLIRNKHAVNIAVFVSREYGGVPLGPKRCELIKQVALDNEDPETITPAEEPRNPRPLPQCTQRKRPYGNRDRWQGQGNNFNTSYRGRGRGGQRGRGNSRRGGGRGGAPAWGLDPTGFGSHGDARDDEVDKT